MTISFFLGFAGVVNWGWDGISRVTNKQIESILEFTPHRVEIWSMYFNVNQLMSCFNKYCDDPKYSDRISFHIGNAKPGKVYSMEQLSDDLEETFNNESKSDIVVIPFISIDAGSKLNKPTLIMYYDEIPRFLLDFNPKLFAGYKVEVERYKPLVTKHLNNKKASFMCVSEYCKRNHLVKYGSHYLSGNDLIKYPDRISVLPLPYMNNISVKRNINNDDFNMLTQHKKFKKPYIFYSSRIRIYKNPEIIQKALNHINNTENIYLALTDETFKPIRFENMKSYVCSTHPLSDFELEIAYNNCFAVVCPSIVEGGLPAQAMEAFYYKKPVILSITGETVSKVKELGFTVKNSGLLFFETDDYETLAKHILYVYNNYNEIIKKQENFRISALKRTWKDYIKDFCLILHKKSLEV